MSIDIFEFLMWGYCLARSAWRSSVQLFYLNCRAYTDLRYNSPIESLFGLVWMISCTSYPIQATGGRLHYNLLLSSFAPLLCGVSVASLSCPSSELCSWERCSGCGVSRASSSSPEDPWSALCTKLTSRSRVRISEPLSLSFHAADRVLLFWIGPASFSLAGSVNFLTNR
ncbi:hypothetical protein B0H11DRAFT_1967342 [Mycena galericulata]|nr:hypothetical protein B0H11DRAFT_2014748 [Mycena galericulata]KAJ7488501.1 hypothetical protein B0H11DRAFT_2012906 [Mycena galericulata]KAJ7501094.1 hypothetical protein B0H11DRAFT_1993589 [Mycena galericulata]KAJ7507492.1 hypothetical protein B0H11DRAFT_1967342 [Mycena galericulata]